MIRIVPATTEPHFVDFRALVREFVTWAVSTAPQGGQSHLVFGKLDNELATLPGQYAAPDGAMVVAYDADGRAAGCLAARRNSATRVEMSRLWVRPAYRGQGVSDALVDAVLQTVGRTGYGEAVLRSRRDMAAAHAVYRRAGFDEVDIATVFPEHTDFEIAMRRPVRDAR